MAEAVIVIDDDDVRPVQPSPRFFCHICSVEIDSVASVRLY